MESTGTGAGAEMHLEGRGSPRPLKRVCKGGYKSVTAVGKGVGPLKATEAVGRVDHHPSAQEGFALQAPALGRGYEGLRVVKVWGGVTSRMELIQCVHWPRVAST